MIISTEIVKGHDTRGFASQVLCISYINKYGKVDFVNYSIPESEYFKWEYAKGKTMPDPYFQSWDFKPVTRTKTKYISEYRIHEIMTDLTASNPDIMNPLYEINSPDTYFCDIEVNVTDEGFPDAKHAKNEVNTISWVHGNEALVFGRALLTDQQIERMQEKLSEHCKGFEDHYIFKYIFYSSEVSMLSDFMYNYFAKADCITGWNFFGYDYPYLFNRCNRLEIDLSPISPTGGFYNYKPYFSQANDRDANILLPTHRLLYDYMEVFAKWDRTVDPKENTKLDWVSEKVLGIKKVEHALGFKEFWEQKPDEYAMYNAVDSILVREIDKKIHTANAMFALASITHVPVLHAFSSVRTLECVQAEYLHRDGRVVPTDKQKAQKSEGYEGAYVYDPIPGAYKNVFALDFRSLYPTTEIMFNISPDTFKFKDRNHKIQADEIGTASGAVYMRNKKGIIPVITQDFFNKRREYKKEMMIAEHEMYELKEIYEKRFGKAI